MSTVARRLAARPAAVPRSRTASRVRAAKSAIAKAIASAAPLARSNAPRAVAASNVTKDWLRAGLVPAFFVSKAYPEGRETR